MGSRDCYTSEISEIKLFVFAFENEKFHLFIFFPDLNRGTDLNISKIIETVISTIITKHIETKDLLPVRMLINRNNNSTTVAAEDIVYFYHYRR